MTPPETALDVARRPLCSLSVHVRRVTGSVVGRPVEIRAVQEELAACRSRMGCVTLEGEPGIGKTRLLLAAGEMAAAEGFTTIAVTADEEIRGPFLVARSIFASPAAIEAAEGTDAEQPLQRAVDAISGRDEPGLEGLSPDRKLLRTFDLAAVAVAALTSVQPVAILVDDVQWADDDSLRLLRYAIRAVPTSPVLLVFSIRPEEMAVVTEAVTLLADMERMGLIRRLRLARFGQVETTEFLQQALGGGIHPPSASTVHAQAEGVPFILDEIAHAYRDAGMLQQIDGMWTLAKNAERLVPSAVRTLIQRRGARLPEEAKVSLAEGAILGRSFSLRDLAAVRTHLGNPETDPGSLAEDLAPAVATGLLTDAPDESAADYSFAHEQVREFAAATLSVPRRRAIHGAIVEMLSAGGEPSPQSLPLLAHHALAAGDTERAARCSVEAARAALAARAPEEVLRLVDLGLPAAAAAQDRLALLVARDEALEMLRRPGDRLDGLAELAALAEALGDLHLELEVSLRRAAVLRMEGEEDRAAEIARRVRKQAAERGDRRAELQASLELGQALLRSPIGEGYTPSSIDTDFDGAEEAYLRAEELAGDLGDQAALAAATRELGVISLSRARGWFVERIAANEHIPIMLRAAAGETPEEILPDLPIAPQIQDASTRFKRALELYEGLGDRRGVMSSIIAMAYSTFGADIHFGPTAARRIEEIRRLAIQMDSLSKESERATAEAQMLYGVHVFARAKIVPDLAVSRGEESYRQARALGDRALEFAAAGGTALAYLQLGEVKDAEGWLDRAAAAAAASPTPFRAGQLELWRGQVRATDGDAIGMRSHLERAVQHATDRGSTPARAEALARLALESARLGTEGGDPDLLDLAARAATQVREMLPVLPGKPPWGAQGDAALTQVALAKGDTAGAMTAARTAMAWLMSAHRDDWFPEILLPVAQAIRAGGSDEERAMLETILQAMLAFVAQRTLDEEFRVRWFRGPIGRALSGIGATGDPGAEARRFEDHEGIAEDDEGVLRLLTLGLTNSEIAERLGISEQELLARLAKLYAKIGASSRADATAFAFRERVV
jgi:DNA-binding CsgD family transcriptional regulator